MPLTDDESSFGYDCIICRELFATRLERNEHVESHFIHKNCTDCNRPVIVIGDIEFELHRSHHCKVPNVCRDTVVIAERLVLTDEKSNRDESKDDILKIEPTNFDTECNNDQCSDRTIEMVCLPDDLAPSIAANKPQSAKPKKRQRKSTITAKTKPKTDQKSDDNNVKKVSRLTKPIHCTQDGCNEEFRQQRIFRMHLKTKHGIIERVHCEICNVSFTDKSNLKHHLILHTDSKRYLFDKKWIKSTFKRSYFFIINFNFFFRMKIVVSIGPNRTKRN